MRVEGVQSVCLAQLSRENVGVGSALPRPLFPLSLDQFGSNGACLTHSQERDGRESAQEAFR